MMTFQVTVPIAGHVFMTVQAESEKDAIDKVLDECTVDDIENWEAIRQFHRGYVCCCPSPWEAEAKKTA